MADNSIRVLHVDDEPEIVELAAEFLEREDDRLAVETETNPTEALEALAENSFDCVVSDYDMPQVNGIELLQRIRDAHPNLPFILYTGKGSEKVASEAISTGATDYLQKGTSTDQYELLANRVLNAVEGYRSGQRTRELQRIRDLIRDINQALVRAPDRATAETEVCELIADSDPYLFAWFGEYDADRQTVEARIGAGVEEGYLDTIEITTDESATGRGPTGQAVRTRELAVMQNIPEQPEYEPWREAALERGYRSSAAVPIVHDDTLFGILNVYADRVNAFDQREQALLMEIGDDFAHAIHSQELTHDLQVTRRAVETTGVPIVWTDVDGTIEYVNSAFEAITGYSADEAIGRTPRILQSGEHDDAFFEELWETILAGEVWEGEVINERADGEQYTIKQTISPILDESGEPARFVSVHTPITEQKERERELRQLTELGIDFLRTEDRNIDTLIDEGLETLGRLVEADRCYIFDIDREAETLSNTHEWCEESVEPQIDMLQELPLDTFSWWIQKLEKFESVTIPNVSELPPEAETEQEILQEQNITSLIVTPMISNGELVGFIGFDWVTEQEAWADEFTDILRLTSELITNMRRREARKRELERHEAYLEQSQDSTTVVDEDGTVQFQSDSVEETTGYRSPEIMRESGFEYVHPEDRQKVTELFTSILGNPGETATAELRVETKDGSWRWVEARGVNKLDDPVIDGIITSSRDITERKESEQELKARKEDLEELTDELETQYRYLFEEAPVMAVVTRAEDGEPIIEECNQLFLDTLGYDRSEVSGHELAEFYTPESRGVLLEEGGYARALSGEFVRENREFLTADDEPVETLLRAVPRVDADESVTGTLAMFIDITERKQLERETDRLQEFTGIVSHDLRNPLNVAQGRLELAREECESEHLDDAANAVDRSFTLIDDLLTLAREGEEISEFETSDLCGMIEECWQNVETKSATLVTETGRTIRADASRLKQLLENLIRNAVEHGGEEVTITIGDLDDGFYFADDGPGIPDAEREQVFEPGYSTGDEGTGLGLNIVKDILEAHGWQIRVTESKDGGARFEITDVELVE